MNMVELVLTVCLVSNPGTCNEEHLYYESAGNLMHCMFQAQPEIAKWSSQHPKKKVMRWACKFPDKDQDI
jgi:hypothetical protein